MNNKKFLKVSVGLIFILATGFIIYLLIGFTKKKEKSESLKNIPLFSMKTIHGNVFTSNDLIHTQPKVIVYFSPDCHFCQAEAKEVSKLSLSYPDIQWVWVASEPIQEIRHFAKQYNLDQQNNIHWCYDQSAIFYQKLGMNSVPYFLVYDGNNQLLKKQSGAIKIEKLVESLQ